VRRSSVTRLVAAALAVAAPAAAAPLHADARETAPQRFFREKLLDDRAVSRDVKTRLRKGGFVDRNVMFSDLTGEGRDDAVVLVHSGGSAGRIALFVFSAGREGEELEIVYRNQRLYRASARVVPGGGNVLARLAYRVPEYAAGDELCCPAAERETELRWSTRRERFGVVARRTIERDDDG
jgi:hypothetical protein